MGIKDKMPDWSYRHHNTEVGLADLLQALVLLKPDDNEAKAIIASNMGFEWKEPTEKKRDTSESKFIPDSFESTLEDSIKKSEIPEQPVYKNITMLTPVSHEKQNIEVLFDKSKLDSTEELEPTKVTLHMIPPRYQPLFREDWFRGLMSVLLAMPTASHDIDLRILEKFLAEGKPLDRLPWRQRPTLKRGVQLFFDHSDSMQPFWGDENKLLERLKMLLGPHNIRLFWFTIDRWHSTDSQLKWHSTNPQLSSETPILIVSDFGIGGDQFDSGIVELDMWLPLMEKAKSYCCPVIALVPEPESFWPRNLKQIFPYSFVWDHDTSIQSVRRSRLRIH
jgi:hypothetical protein